MKREILFAMMLASCATAPTPAPAAAIKMPGFAVEATCSSSQEEMAQDLARAKQKLPGNPDRFYVSAETYKQCTLPKFESGTCPRFADMMSRARAAGAWGDYVTASDQYLACTRSASP